MEDYLTDSHQSRIPMKNKFYFILICFIGLISNAADDSMHLITVNGVSEVLIDPNLVNLQIEIWGKGSSAKLAQQTQADIYAKFKAVVDKFKIKKDDLKTENFNLNPDIIYDSKTQQNKTVGYRSSHQISLVIRKIDEVGSFMDALAPLAKEGASGGTSVQSLNWDSDKKGTIENSAIADAVRAARDKAELLAKSAGVSIKAVHRLSHTTSQASMNRSGMEMVAMKAMSDSAASGTEVSSGKIKVHVDVQMEFQIEGR